MHGRTAENTSARAARAAGAAGGVLRWPLAHPRAIQPARHRGDDRAGPARYRRKSRDDRDPAHSAGSCRWARRRSPARCGCRGRYQKGLWFSIRSSRPCPCSSPARRRRPDRRLRPTLRVRLRRRGAVPNTLFSSQRELGSGTVAFSLAPGSGRVGLTLVFQPASSGPDEIQL